MTIEMIVTLAILVAALILFITEKIRLDLVALCVMASLMLTGVITVEEGLAGFSNKAVISIAALFIVGGAVFQTGLAGLIAERILRVAHGSLTRLLVILMLSVALMSAFISSTGVVALMLPAVISLARSMRINTSKLLLPMAYAALLGGTLTLIGTPPNLLVSESLREAGYAPFDFFSFTPLALCLLLVGVLYMVLVGRRLLPDPRIESHTQSVITPAELFAIYELPGSLFRLRVQTDSPLIGQTISESGIGSVFHLHILAITHRSDEPRRSILVPNRNSCTRPPPPDTRLQADDVLLVQGEPDCIAHATAALKLAVLATAPVVEDDIITNEVGIAEVLLRPRSSLIGETVASLQFSRVYQLTVLALKRPEHPHSLPVKDTPLEFGDVLLVQGEWKHIFNLKRHRRDFVVMGEREALEVGAGTLPDKAPITLLVLVGMVLVVALNLLDLATASILAGLAVILTGCLKADDAYDTIDLKTLFLMAGILPLSTALSKVGLVDLFAGGLVEALGQGGPVLVQIGFFVLVVTLTQFLSNTATVMLVAPLALATAVQLGVQPQSLMMTVAMAASMAFATPLATPINTLVMSAGHYRFNDYVRVGVPLIILSLIVSIIVLPLFYPF